MSGGRDAAEITKKRFAYLDRVRVKATDKIGVIKRRGRADGRGDGDSYTVKLADGTTEFYTYDKLELVNKKDDACQHEETSTNGVLSTSPSHAVSEIGFEKSESREDLLEPSSQTLPDSPSTHSPTTNTAIEKKI